MRKIFFVVTLLIFPLVCFAQAVIGQVVSRQNELKSGSERSNEHEKFCYSDPAKSRFHSDPSKWTEPRVYHSEFDDCFANRIIIIHQNLDIKLQNKVFSPNKSYWFAVDKPDTMKDGPWSTFVNVYNERDYLIKIELRDHCSWEPTIKWINEKLMLIGVWWGRILGTEFIFDV